jgi:hypothetical protein
MLPKTFLSRIMYRPDHEKSSPKMRAEIVKITTLSMQVNNHTLGKNSPNLVTLIVSERKTVRVRVGWDRR